MGVPSSPVRSPAGKQDFDMVPAMPAASSGQDSHMVPAEPVKSWWEVRDFVLQLCTFAGGPAAAIELAATNRTFHKAVAEAWEDLARSFPVRLYVVGGLDGSFKPVSTAWRLDFSQDAWEELPPIASARAGPAAIEAQGCLYVLGGEFCGDAVNDSQRFDPSKGAWEDLAPMLEARIRASAAALAGHVYAIGGLDGLQPLRSAERYDPQTNTWEALPPMHRPRYACASAVVRGCIVVFGGELTDAGCAASIERYDPASNSWELLPAARVPLCGAAYALTRSGETAFSVGGLGLNGQALPVAERLPLGSALAAAAPAEPGAPAEPLLSSFVPPAWVHMAPMLTPRHLASVAGFGSGAVVVGGKGPSFEAISNVELYHADVNTWEMLPAMPSPRLRAAVVAGRL